MKKVLAMLLVLVMAVSALAGCGGGGNETKGTQAGSTPAGDTKETAAPAGDTQGTENSEGTQAPAAAVNNEEYATLELYAISFGGNNDSLAKVNEKLNEYLKPILNTGVHLNIVSAGSYAQQVNLMMSSTEQVDLMLSTGALTTMLSAQGALQPLDELLTNFGQGIVDVMGQDVINACMYNGEVCAVPTNRDLARSFGFFYRKDYNEQYGLELEKCKNLDDLTAAFAKLKEANPDIVAIGGNSENAMDPAYEAWDELGNMYGVLSNYGEKLEVVNKYATPEYKEMIELMHEWYQNGYIYSEIDTSTTSNVDLFKTGKYLGFIANWNPSSNNAHSQANGVEMGFVELLEPFMSTMTIQTAAWTIPYNSKYPERAMQLLNLMYTDPTVVNLLTYGIEGENYVIVDEANGIIDYPEGMDATTKTYDNTLDWMWGNMLIGYTWKGNDPTLHQQMIDFNNSAKRSKALGFVYDSTNVENELTACTNVATRYTRGLQSGKLDPSVLDEFLSELETAGIKTIIDDKQEQLNAWAQANGIK